MKNITVTVPDEVYRQACVHAVEQGKSLSALVADYLQGLAGQEAEARLESLQRRVQGGITRFRARDRLDRDQLHDRALR